MREIICKKCEEMHNAKGSGLIWKNEFIVIHKYLENCTTCDYKFTKYFNLYSFIDYTWLCPLLVEYCTCFLKFGSKISYIPILDTVLRMSLVKNKGCTQHSNFEHHKSISFWHVGTTVLYPIVLIIQIIFKDLLFLQV